MKNQGTASASVKKFMEYIDLREVRQTTRGPAVGGRPGIKSTWQIGAKTVGEPEVQGFIVSPGALLKIDDMQIGG